jgi:8-oxo-dGTP pyrophosphatase MutT (NUDIX family)
LRPTQIEVYLFRRRSGRVEFLCLKRAARGRLPGIWQPITGGLRRGEGAFAGAKREVREETGLEVEPVRLIGVYSAPAHHQIVTYPDGNVIHYVSTSLECRIVGGDLACGSESADLGWFAPDALPPELMPMHRIRIVDALAARVDAFVR